MEFLTISTSKVNIGEREREGGNIESVRGECVREREGDIESVRGECVREREGGYRECEGRMLERKRGGI